MIEEHWERKQRYKKGQSTMIDFDMAGKAIRGLLKAQQHWVAKTAARFLPYRKNMRQWKLGQEDKCPQCQQPEENKSHIMQCKAAEAQQNWDKALQQLDKWMVNAKTNPTNRQEIIQGL